MGQSVERESRSFQKGDGHIYTETVRQDMPGDLEALRRRFTRIATSAAIDTRVYAEGNTVCAVFQTA
ncbi:MAG: hypothetical protein AAF907_08180, partial [Planctomycetota bacterium]